MEQDLFSFSLETNHINSFLQLIISFNHQYLRHSLHYKAIATYF